jgi:hypothetical protein
MEFKYSKRYTNPYLKMKIKEHYTTSLILCILDTVRDDEEIKKDVNHRIQTKWIKWKNTLDVICTVKLHSNVMKVSLHSYKTVLLRPAMLYKTKYWAAKKQDHKFKYSML